MITEATLLYFDNASIEELRNIASVEVVNKVINFNKSIEKLIKNNIINDKLFNNTEKINILKLTGSLVNKLYEITYKHNKIKYCNKCNKYFDFLHNNISKFDKDDLMIYNVNHKTHKIKYIYE